MALTLDPMIRMIRTMMDRFGGISTLSITTSASAYNYETSTTEKTVTDYPVQTIAFDYIQKKDGIGANEGNTLVRSGDKQLFIKPLPGVPLPNPKSDSITYNGVVHSIITIKDYNPSGNQSILLECYIRE